MNTAITRTDGATTRMLRVEWGVSKPFAIEIRHNDDPEGDVTFLDTGYPWESCVLREDLVEVA